jgi:catechol 2,3-dioxygenase-like lactoylglutathione lyase family enzyme
VIHHLAIAVKDFQRSHDFYTEVMGFELVKVVKAATTGGGGWTSHAFYDTGGGDLLALWDLGHAEGLGEWTAGLSTGVGLPEWVNHIAFLCEGPDDLERHKARWLERGMTVVAVEHDFINSIYARDPDGTMVEWTHRVRPLDASDRVEAERLLAETGPGDLTEYPMVVLRPDRSAPVA